MQWRSQEKFMGGSVKWLSASMYTGVSERASGGGVRGGGGAPGRWRILKKINENSN